MTTVVSKRMEIILKGIGYDRLTVSRSYSNPVNGANTRSIECLWSTFKFDILRKTRATNEKCLLPSH